MTKHLMLTTILGLCLTTPAWADKHPVTGEELAATQSYTYWMLDSAKSLDPDLATSVEDADLIRSLMEGLYEEDAAGAIVPAGALSHEVSADLMTYTFHLRPEAKWSNGDPVVASDYVYAWQRITDPALASEYAWYLELAQIVNAGAITRGEKPASELGVKAIDDLTLEVKIEAPLPYFPKMLTHQAMFPVSKKAVDAHGDEWTKPGNYVGNGAYTLKEHLVGEKVVMEKSPTYWNAANVIMSPITAVTINDENAAWTRWEAGELDRSTVPSGQFPRLKAQYPDEVSSNPSACAYYYVINIADGKGNEALHDPRVRTALSYAIDRNIVIDNILQAGQIPAYSATPGAIDGFVLPTIAYSAMTQEERNEAAKALLAEAGYGPDKPLTFALNYNTSEGHQKIAVAIQQMWKQTLGVEMTPQNYEWAVHTDKMHSGDYDMARYAWCGDYNEASTFLDLWTSYSGNNDAKYNSPEYDALLKDAKTMADPNPNYTKAEELLAKDMPIIPIYHYTQVRVVRKDIKGLPTTNVLNTWYAKNLYRVAQ
jgi:oligopeptide transport system substrate-binding protein